MNARQRYEAAVAFIRASDVLRVLTRAGMNTDRQAEAVSRERHLMDGRVPPKERTKTYRGVHRA